MLTTEALISELPEDGKPAISQFNGNDLNGRNLRVNVAKPRESRDGGRSY